MSAVVAVPDDVQLPPPASASAAAADAVSSPSSTSSVVSLTVRSVLQNYLNISSVPRRYFFQLLSVFAPEPREAERLAEFASAAGQDDMLNYCTRAKRTCLEVLQDFPSTRGHVPVESLFDLFPPLQPRSFSIASSLQQHPGRIQLAVAIVNYQTIMHKPRVGVFTSWLAELDPTSESHYMDIWLQKGTFQLPAPTVPLVMIGPGTGVAPFRSIIEQRLAQQATDTVLFFGNRNRAADFLFGEEMQRYADAGSLTLFTAFSRDQEQKVYVQHVMREQQALLWELIGRRKAVVLLAGNAKRMPIDVENALAFVFEHQGGMSAVDARAYLAAMTKEGRFQTETWS
eukprot:m.164227 g.164227  ORF g.164227 m.164227 type:complete len:343 (-) comp17130_c0_seq2:233-1261(-)